MRRTIGVAFVVLLGSSAFAQEELPTTPPAERPNPLPGIVDKMKAVEKKLAEAETGELSQVEQKAIAKALEIDQDALVGDLQKLIDEIESSAQSGGGQGGDPSGEKKPGGSKGGQKQPSKPRDQGGQEKPANPEKPGGEGEQNKNQTDEAKNDEKSEADPGDSSYNGEKKRAGDPDSAWNPALPPKRQGEVLEAKRREPPPAWKKQIDEYFKRLTKPKK